jgi:hypothetical protein
MKKVEAAVRQHQFLPSLPDLVRASAHIGKGEDFRVHRLSIFVAES